MTTVAARRAPRCSSKVAPIAPPPASRRSSRRSAARRGGPLRACSPPTRRWCRRRGCFARSPTKKQSSCSTTGARGFHPRAIGPLRRAGIPLLFRDAAAPDPPGTEVSAQGGGATPRVKAVACRSQVMLLSLETAGMWQRVGFLAELFARIARHGLSVDLVSTAEANVTVSFDAAPGPVDGERLQRLAGELAELGRPRVLGPCAAVTLVGRQIRSILHRLGPLLEAFEEQPVHLVTQAATDLNLTFVVDDEQAVRLVRELHELLLRRQGEDELLGPTWEELRGDQGLEGGVDAVGAALVAAEARSAARRRRGGGAGLRLRPRLAGRRRRAARRAAGARPRPLLGQGQPARRRAARSSTPRASASSASRRASSRTCSASSPTSRPSASSSPPTSRHAPSTTTPSRAACGSPSTTSGRCNAGRETFAGRELFLRLDPGHGRGHHRHVRTAGTHSKFGIPLAELDEAATARARDRRPRRRPARPRRQRHPRPRGLARGGGAAAAGRRALPRRRGARPRRRPRRRRAAAGPAARPRTSRRRCSPR